MMLSKNVKSSRYTRYSRDGFEILQIYDAWGTYNVVAKNNHNEYVWGHDYDLERGMWSGGDYSNDLSDVIKHIYGRLVVDNINKGDLRR